MNRKGVAFFFPNIYDYGETAGRDESPRRGGVFEDDSATRVSLNRFFLTFLFPKGKGFS
jgi:hypothetical protein